MRQFFGKTPLGREIYAHTVSNETLSITVLDYGAALHRLVHKGTDVVCGFNTLEDYIEDKQGVGAVIGRYAGLIRSGKITIDGVDFPLTCNEETSHNDGGKIHFGRHTWNVEDGVTHDGYPSICCGYISADGEEGYPGRLIVTVNYILKGDSLIIDCKATTDKPTYCNLSNRSFFNLHGCSNISVSDHMLTVYADTYTDPSGAPRRRGVEETEFDFRTEKKVGDIADSFDCSFVLDRRQTERCDDLTLNLAAVCRTAERELTMLTSMPCLRIATGNKFDGAQLFKSGVRRYSCQGLCIEAQYEPDSPAYGLARLNPERPYHHITVFRLK